MSDPQNTRRRRPCLSCPALCCSRNLINVCGHDIWLIANALSIDPTAFLAFARMGAASPYHFRLDDSGTAYCVVLNMREHPDGSRRCVFLMDLPNGQTRCGVYGLRPVACRAYPLVLDEGRVEVKHWAMCHEEYEPPSGADVSLWQAELERHDMEFSIYALAVRTWNRRVTEQPGSRGLDFRPYLGFLMEAYARLEAARRTVPPKSWPRIWNRWRGFTAEGLNPALLQPDDPADDHVWTSWLESIREAVAEAAEGICDGAAEPSRQYEEMPV